MPIKKLCSILWLSLIFSMFLSSFIMIKESSAMDPAKLAEISTYKPIVYVDPPETVADVGETFTVHVKVFNLTAIYIDKDSYGDLYGLDIKFTWEPIFLEYVNHTVKIPVETHPDGVLHKPVLPVRDVVDATAGTYTLAYASMAPAPAFNNPNASNTIFTITFRVRAHGGVDLKLTRVKLSNKGGFMIHHETRDGAFRTPNAPVAGFSTFPDNYPVINKRVEFDASPPFSYDPDGTIIEYIWDFGDGNKKTTQSPFISHEYGSVGLYKVKLRVIDNDGLTSPTFIKRLEVVKTRNLTVKNITLPVNSTFHGETLTINVAVENNGDAPETFKVSLNYNATADGNWALIQEKEMSLPPRNNITVGFRWNTSEVPKEMAELSPSLFLLANVTPIPHEENITDNVLISTQSIQMLPILHDIAVADLDIKAISKTGKEFAPPLIIGEMVNIRFKIQVKGNQDENYSISVNILAPNGTTFLSHVWQGEYLERGEEKKYTHTFNETVFIAGNYIVAINATLIDKEDSRAADNSIEKTFLVINQPQIEISAPRTVYLGEEVKFSATVQGAESPVKYRWTRIKPGEVSEINRRETKDVIYIFRIGGNWTVRLMVTDGFGITYNPDREATSAYKAEATIEVMEKAASLTPQLERTWLIITGLTIALIFIAVAYLKLKRPSKIS